MHEQAQVVIIGGGIAGCSIAYHLACLGWTDVILLDKGELTSGSTWHAAGVVTHFHTSPALMRMRKVSIDLYRRLQHEAGHHIGWNEVGSLRIASSADQFKFLQRQVGMAKAIGLEVEIISPAEALRIFPLMSDVDLYGAIYLPNDGHLDPNGVTMELARRAKELGVTIYTDTRVTAIDLSSDNEVIGVRVARSDDFSHPEATKVATTIVVNAAGMWGRQVGELAGVDLPMTPLVHQHLTTRPIPGHELPHDTPCFRDPENLVYMREEAHGFLIGGFEREPVAWGIDGVPWDFTQKLLPSDWELFGPIMEGAIKRIPILAQAELMHLLNGPEAITPDSRPLLGPVPGVPGFWAACGLSHTGFGAGGAIGEIIANWIVNGEAPYDVTEMNVRRFGPIYNDRAYAAERARESYKYYYVLRYPHDENEWARERRLSPLDPRQLELGAVFGEKNGWERVNYFERSERGKPGRRAGADQHRWGWGRAAFFEQVGEEHQAVRERVALFDMTSFGKIDVRGPGALALLQYLADNDIAKSIGSVIYTQFLNPRGGIESDLTITRLADDHFRIVTGSNFVAGDLGWIKMHLSGNSVEVREVTEEWACIGMWGPRARDVLQAASRSNVSNEVMPYMTARAIDLAGVDVWAQRVTYVGELGWELYVQTQDAVRVWDALMSAGQRYGIQPAGYKVLDSLRLEKGYRYWSTDITPSDNPYAAGLGFCVRLKKGDFIGRAALLALKEQGLQQKICTVTLEGEACVLYGGEAVYHKDRIVGRLRSGGYGYTLSKNIGFVYLPIELTHVGTILEVEVFGERFKAEVAPNVLYDPKGERLHT